MGREHPPASLAWWEWGLSPLWSPSRVLPPVRGVQRPSPAFASYTDVRSNSSASPDPAPSCEQKPSHQHPFLMHFIPNVVAKGSG